MERWSVGVGIEPPRDQWNWPACLLFRRSGSDLIALWVRLRVLHDAFAHVVVQWHQVPMLEAGYHLTGLGIDIGPQPRQGLPAIAVPGVQGFGMVLLSLDHEGMRRCPACVNPVRGLVNSANMALPGIGIADDHAQTGRLLLEHSQADSHDAAHRRLMFRERDPCEFCALELREAIRSAEVAVSPVAEHHDADEFSVFPHAKLHALEHRLAA